MSQLAVIVGRFQVPYLTAGHIDFLNRTLDENPNVLVVLGCAPAPIQPDNALTVEMRKQMFTKLFPSEQLQFTDIMDVGDDKVWSENLDMMLKSYCAQKGFDSYKVYGSRDSFLKAYDGAAEAASVPHRYSASGTALRKLVNETTVYSDDFRAGVIWMANNRYPINYATVDIVIGRNNFTEILLGRKRKGGRFVLIGGFADPKSPSYEDDAIRETEEETGLIVTDPQYITSRLIDDWRYRNSPDKIKTMLFAVDTDPHAVAVANDDIVEVHWFKLPEVKEALAPHHRLLFEEFLKWRNKKFPINLKLSAIQNMLLDAEGADDFYPDELVIARALGDI